MTTPYPSLFSPINFDRMNETDVREEILAPLLALLGYRTGTANNVIREQSLRYPRAFLGRKDPKHDPLLRGKADYVLQADGKVHWVIEAKAPFVDLAAEDIEQAWTYANHPEIRAVYFVLCNGRTLQIFQTNQGPTVPAILSLNYEEFPSAIERLKNILSPAAILRDFPGVAPDTGQPLGPGLRSIVRITNGLIRYEWNSLQIPALNELQVSIREGAIERDEEGRMVAYLHTVVPSRSLQELHERLKLAAFEMVGMDKALSTEQQNPSVFIYENTITLPSGARLFDLSTWREVVLPRNLSCETFAEAKGFLQGSKLMGAFHNILRFVEPTVIVRLRGSFEAFLA